MSQIKHDILASDLAYHLPHTKNNDITTFDDDTLEKIAQRILSHGETISKAIAVVIYKLD